MSPRIIAANLMVRIRSFYREKSAVFFTIAFPVILILVFGTIFLKQDHMSYDLQVQDLDRTTESAQFIKVLAQSGVFTIIPVDSGADAARYFKDSKLNLLLVIPKGYAGMQEQRIMQRDSNASIRMTYLYDPSSTSVPKKMQILDAIIAELNQKVSGTEPFIRLAEKSILDKKYRFIEFFVPGIIAMAVMTSSMSGALNVNAELRQKGIIRKLCATPITRTDWILSNVLYQLILAAISTTAILLVSYAVFNVSLQINGWLPVFVTLDVFAFVGIGMILTRVVKEAESAAAAANVIMFPVMFLSGTFFPIEMMPGFLQKFARLLPLYYVNEGLRASMVFVDHGAVLRYAAVIAGIAAGVFILGIRATKWEESA
jgi:ABC-2 type transport system permease protein